MTVTVDVHGIELGHHYQDTATTFSGVATAVWAKWKGTTQVSLARIGQDGKPFEQWFDAERLEPVMGARPW